MFAYCGASLCATEGTNRSWSLHPLTRPSVPQVRNVGWPKTPVDNFILHKLEQSGLSPAPPAEKNTLLRRVYFDLIGLPPAPAATHAFLADDSPGAYEHVVDELLASPRYGERWARHWLDVIHFAESHGHDQDRIRTNAWPYRDYVVESLNSDKPYRRFIQEQLAGDVLFPENPQATVALGFLAAGPWDESSLRDIREDTIDREIGRYLDRDDIVTTTMSTFTSTTVHCARCHQHKFDPVSQQDYYSLQAVFAGTDRADRFFDPDPAIHLRRQKLMHTKSLLEQKDAQLMASLAEPSMQMEVNRWAQQVRTRRAGWITIPGRPDSAQGATLTLHQDGSIHSTGARPEKDTYTVVATNVGGVIRAVRLEVLADPSLPHSGPGRQDNGNLHLTEFQLFATTASGTNLTPVEIETAKANFNQDGWTIQHALDGNIKTAWGIYPKVGQSHHAMFGLKEPLVLGNASTLKFELAQLHGGGHLIGRFRLSVTTNEPSLEVLPDQIAALVDLPARSAKQAVELGLYYLERKVTRELQELPLPRKVYAGGSDFIPDGGHKPSRVPRPVHLLKRGEITRRGEAASPGALSCIESLPARFSLADPQDEGSRRAALAAWITDANNPLTWRSIVNRVWHFHFGHGIVDTPNDFGLMGGAPSHPELLDWLAATFRDDGSLKRLHKRIVLSAAYRQSVRHNAAFATIDADNRLLWRMNRTRLDAEEIRDSILQMTESLNLKMGGPSFMNFALSTGIHVTPNVDYSKVNLDDPELNRRSIYRFLFRTLPDPFMDTLDCPSGSQLTPVRTASFTALQAMAVLNDPFVTAQSEKMARRLAGHSPDVDKQIAFACRLAYGRSPNPDEQREFTTYVQRHGLANLCRLLWNSNEFIFVN